MSILRALFQPAKPALRELLDAHQTDGILVELFRDGPKFEVSVMTRRGRFPAVYDDAIEAEARYGWMVEMVTTGDDSEWDDSTVWVPNGDPGPDQPTEANVSVHETLPDRESLPEPEYQPTAEELEEMSRTFAEMTLGIGPIEPTAEDIAFLNTQVLGRIATEEEFAALEREPGTVRVAEPLDRLMRRYLSPVSDLDVLLATGAVG